MKLFKIIMPFIQYLVGIYNGARGRVVGFAFRECTSTITTPMHAIFHTMFLLKWIEYTIQQGSQDIIAFVVV